MALLTPSRLGAAFWLAVLGGLAWLTTPGSWWEWSDRDSVPRLTAERACELAKVRGFEQATCSDFTTTDEAASVKLSLPPLESTACFLRAGRWFLTGRGRDATCIEHRPAVERISNHKREQLVEAQWVEAATMVRNQAAHARFTERVGALIRQHRAQPAPRDCGTLKPGAVPAFDADGAVRGRLAPWHFLTSDVFERKARLDDVGSVVQSLLDRNAGLLLVVDATEKQLPSTTSPGRLVASVLLVDWLEPRLLCEAPLVVETPSLGAPPSGGDDPLAVSSGLGDAQREVRRAIARALETRATSRQGFTQPQFRQAVSKALEAEVAALTGGALTVQKTD